MGGLPLTLHAGTEKPIQLLLCKSTVSLHLR